MIKLRRKKTGGGGGTTLLIFVSFTKVPYLNVCIEESMQCKNIKIKLSDNVSFNSTGNNLRQKKKNQCE